MNPLGPDFSDFRDPMIISLILGTLFSILGSRIGSLKYLKKTGLLQPAGTGAGKVKKVVLEISKTSSMCSSAGNELHRCPAADCSEGRGKVLLAA